VKLLTHNPAILLLSFLFACSLTSPPVSVEIKDASVEGARAAIVQLIEFSNKQALQTEPARKLLIGEIAQLNISTFGKITDAPDKVLLLEKNRAVARVQLFGNNNHVTDVYFYLQYDGSWKISEVRLLALTGMIEQSYLALQSKQSLNDEEKDDFANLKLTLATDKELAVWLAENRKSLEQLYELVRAKSGKEQFYIRSEDAKFPEVTKLLKNLHLTGLSIEPNGNVEMVIGGVMDNVVGFIYSPTNNPPAINPSSYIWVEEVAARWYLFRTT